MKLKESIDNFIEMINGISKNLDHEPQFNQSSKWVDTNQFMG